MELFEMRYVCAVFEARNFSKAAEMVHVSQPALSQSIKKIEEEIGAPLFLRNTRNVVPTEIGVIVYGGSKRMLEENQEMIARLAEILNAKKTTIRIGMSPFYSKHYLPLVLRNVRSTFPHVNLKMEECISESQEEMLKGNKLDFCCVPQDPQIEGLAYDPICMEEILLAVPPNHPLNKHCIPASPFPFIDFKLVDGQDFVSLRPVQKINKLLNPLLKASGIHIHIVYETLDWDMVNVMVANGVGLGFVPDILCGAINTEASPIYYRIAADGFLRRFSIAYKADRVITPLEKSLMALFKSSILEARAMLRQGRNPGEERTPSRAGTLEGSRGL